MAKAQIDLIGVGGGSSNMQYVTSDTSTSTSTTISGLTSGKKYFIVWIASSSGSSAATTRVTVNSISGGIKTDVLTPSYLQVASSNYIGYSAINVETSSTSITITRAGADKEVYLVFEYA